MTAQPRTPAAQPQPQPQSLSQPSRRQVLCGLAVALLAPGALAAACADGGSGSATGTTSRPAGGATGGAPGGGGSTGALAKLADIPVGGGKIVEGPQGKVLLVQPSAGTVRAYDPICPHQSFTVSPPQGGTITCVEGHGSQFSDADGSLKRGPATRGLTTIDVTVDGDSIVLA